jgi:hypothetical protein
VVDRRTTIRFWRVGDQAFCGSCEAEDAPEAELLVVDCAVASVIRCSSCGWALTDVMRGDEVE